MLWTSWGNLRHTLRSCGHCSWLQVNYDLRGIEGCGGALGVPLPRKQQGKAHKGDRRVLGALLLVAFFFLLRAR